MLSCNPSTSINDFSDKQDILIYPNPVSSNITIEASHKTTVEISNIQGQLLSVSQQTIPGNKTNIDVSSLPCGVYIVEVKTEKVAVREILKE